MVPEYGYGEYRAHEDADLTLRERQNGTLTTICARSRQISIAETLTAIRCTS